MRGRNVFKAFSNFIHNNKRLSIFIAAALLIICAAVVITIVAVSMGQTPPSDDGGKKYPAYNPITEGQESRIYYYDVAGGETLLTLKNNWKFTLIGPDINKSGDYMLNGDQVILDFVRDEDGTASATPGDNKMIVVLNGATLTFREKLVFSVSFDTNGGSEVKAVQVVNGKTVSAPTAPTKENCDFAGWYTDKDLSKPFEFGVTIITSDTVLYAKWTNQ